MRLYTVQCELRAAALRRGGRLRQLVLGGELSRHRINMSLGWKGEGEYGAWKGGSSLKSLSAP